MRHKPRSLNSDEQGVHLCVPFALPDRIEHLGVLSLRLGVHAALDFGIFGFFDDVGEEGVPCSQADPMHTEVSSPLARGVSPEENEIQGTGIVQGKYLRVEVCRDVGMIRSEGAGSKCPPRTFYRTE